MPPGVQIVDVAAGDGHSLALTSTGAVYAWGANGYGQLGDGTTTDRSTPTPVALPAGTIVSAIAAGETYSLALTNLGEIYAWGNGSDGNLGNGGTASSSLPTLVQLPPGVVAVSLTAGGNRCHLLSANGKIYDWGTAENGSHITLVPTFDAMPAGEVPVAIYDGPDAEQYIALMVPNPTPSPSPTPTASSTPTDTPTPSPTDTPTPLPTDTPTAAPS